MYPDRRKNLSISSLADKMDNTEKDILRALNYWEKNKLIHLIKDENSGEITGIEILNPDNCQNLPHAENTVKTTKNTVHHESTSSPKQTNTYITSVPGIHSIPDEKGLNEEISNNEVLHKKTLAKKLPIRKLQVPAILPVQQKIQVLLQQKNPQVIHLLVKILI